jgi:hypothetical protein
MTLKKYFLCLLSIFCIPSLYIYSQQKLSDLSLMEKAPVFNDPFDNNANNWITENSWVKGNILNGYYTIACKNYNGSTGLSYKAIQIDKGRDFEFETSIKINRGTGGFVFGLTEKFENYRIEFGNKNKILILKDSPSNKKPVENLYTASAKSYVKTGDFIKVNVKKIKGRFYLFVNDSLISQIKNILPEGGQVGFNVGLNSEIIVDYLNVNYISFKPATLIADNKPSANKSSSDYPQIQWISPSGIKTTIETYSAKIKTRIVSASGIKDLLFYVNGVASKGEPDIKSMPGDSGIFQVEKIINLSPGENNIYMVVTNSVGSAKSDLRYFSIPSATFPFISWQNPVLPAVAVNTDNFPIKVCIQSLTELRSVKVIVNGSQQPEQNVLQASATGDCNYTWQCPVILKEGNNDIYVIATNIAGSSTSEKREIKLSYTLSEKRLALVFGNAEYGNKVSLKNPANDANLMEATLKDLNFDVIKRINAGKSEMEQAIMEFTSKLPFYNVALFYYAGHGIQVDGINYLMPTDAKLEEKANCQWEAISLNDVVKQFEKYPDNINIVILDACRNNPFKNWVRGDEAGFKFLPNVSGTIIGYATAEGATAADGSGANGLYTEELVKQMAIPQAVESVFKKTRVQVEQRSKGMQSPQETTGLRGDFYFVK